MVSIPIFVNNVAKLFRALAAVTLPTEHLAVLNNSAAMFAPRLDVVALHELEVELLAAKGAFVFLLFPYGEFDVIGECAEVEVMLVACQYIGDDARLPLYLTVTHQF